MALHPAPTKTRRFGNKVVTQPALEPVTLDEAKGHMRITDSDSDGYIIMLIRQARSIIEQISGLALITQSWKLSLDNWGGQTEPWWDGVRVGAISELSQFRPSIDLPKYPLQSVDSVTTYDWSSNPTSITVATTFDIDTNSIRGRMTLQSGKAWPTALRRTNAIEIEYTAGYGDTPFSIPEPLKRAVLVLVAYLYDHRGNCGMHDAWNKSGADQLTRPYRDVSI